MSLEKLQKSTLRLKYAIIEVDKIYLGPHFDHLDEHVPRHSKHGETWMRVRRPTRFESKCIAENEQIQETTVKTLWILVHGKEVYDRHIENNLCAALAEIWELDNMDMKP